MATLMLVNPKKRRKRRTKSRAVARRKSSAPAKRRRKRNPARNAIARVSRRRRRRNPIGGKNFTRNVQDQFITALGGASGALALDVAFGMLPLPEMLKSGMARHIAKASVAVGMGVLLNQFKATKRYATPATTGALTVMLHGLMRDGLTKVAPQLTLGEYTDEELFPEGLGEYLDTDIPGLGYINAGRVTNDWEESDGIGIPDYSDEIDI